MEGNITISELKILMTDALEKHKEELKETIAEECSKVFTNLQNQINEVV